MDKDQILSRYSESKKRGCPTCDGLDPKSCMRCRGKAIHKTIELDVRGDLDEDNLPEWLQPVLAQWRKFCSDTGFKVIDSEKRLYHPTYDYAGTEDLFGELRSELAYVDVKRTFFAGKVTGLQLAAYQAADVQSHPERKNASRYALRLNESQSYKLEPFTDKSDFQNFLVALNFYRLRQRIAASC